MKERLDLEEELLGVCVSGHATDAYAESRNNEFVRFDKLKDNVEADVFGLVKTAKKYNTSKKNVLDIIKRNTWKHV